MISYLKGILTSKSPTDVIIDVGGVGFHLLTTLQSYEALPNINSPVEMKTYLHVREDILQLYGFIQDIERQMFLHLLSVTGIGPRIALNLLSSVSSEHLKVLIQNGNSDALSALPGIGKKTSERIIVELRDKLSKSQFESVLPTQDSNQELFAEALKALMALGYSRQNSEGAISSVIRSHASIDMRVEELIRGSIQQLFSSKTLLK